MRLHNVTITPRSVTVAGDTHDPDEPTPIYDQLMDETYGQILHNCELNGRPVRVKFPKGADQ